MKHPTAAGFRVRKTSAAVTVTFKPTGSTYTFSRFADAEDIKVHGPISRHPTVTHPSGDTGDYVAGEVLQLAYDVACNAAL
jgi:hypothetical protein